MKYPSGVYISEDTEHLSIFDFEAQTITPRVVKNLSRLITSNTSAYDPIDCLKPDVCWKWKTAIPREFL